MINFKSINIEGFGSFVQPTEFKLNRNGLTIIRGRVGAGKTTIPSALCWCGFGTGLKNKSSIETWEELRTPEYQGTKVELNFTKGNKEYTIIRCLNYKGKIEKVKGGNNLFIKVDGSLLHNERNKNDKQDFINELLGYSFSLFTNSIVFGQRMKKIIEESGPTKKKIFEEAFEVTFIEEAKKSVKSELDKTQGLIGKLNVKVEELETKASELKGDIKDALEDEKEFKANKKKRINEAKIDLKELQAKKLKLDNIENKVSEVDVEAIKERNRVLADNIKDAKKANNKIKEYLEKIVELEAEETKLYKEPKEDIKICPTCGGTLSFKASKKLTKKRKDRLDELKIEIDRRRDKFMQMDKVDKDKLEKEVNKNLEKLNKHKIDLALAKVNKVQQSECAEQIIKAKRKLTEARNERLIVNSTKYEHRLTKVNKKLSLYSKQMKTLKDSREIDAWLISDPLSNTGLKAYIFDNLLGEVNNYLNEYSKILGFKVEFGIDLQSSRKDFYQNIIKDNIMIMYDDLSGGQKQLVDTSVALAIHSVISSIRPVNVLFMDEPFEGLDEETIETVAELLDYKCKQQCLYLITHHSSFNPINAKEITMRLSPEGHTIVS